MAFSAVSQSSYPISIQSITIKDTILIKEVEKLIQEEVNREMDTTTTNKVFADNFFKKGLGYVRLYIEGNLAGDTLFRYYIAASLISLKEGAEDATYPPFYTYIGGRLVLVYMPILENVAALNYSSKSKRELRKRVDAFLEKPQNVKIYNQDGSLAFKDKTFRIDYFRFHGGKYIYVLKDKPPIVVNE